MKIQLQVSLHCLCFASDFTVLELKNMYVCGVNGFNSMIDLADTQGAQPEDPALNSRTPHLRGMVHC